VKRGRSWLLAGGAALLAALSTLPAAAGVGAAAGADPAPGARRIVTLAPSLAEIVAGLGRGDWIVGVESFTNWPPELQSLPRVGSYVDPNLESILALKPDLVLGSADGNPEAVLERIRRLGIPIHVSDPMILEGIRTSIEELGTLLDARPRARELIETMDQGIGRIRTAVAGRPRPRVLLLFESEPISTAGRGTFTDELIRIAGGRSISAAEERDYLQLSIEAVLAARPEVIVLSSMDPLRDHQRILESWRRWPILPAVRDGRIHVVDADLLSRPSQRIVLGLEALARLFHPAAFAPEQAASSGYAD